MCLYLGNNDSLTYKKQEHVFPAGLGGKRKLEYGAVSDQANELFSAIELKLIRHSLIAFERMMYGPGKRGSLNPRKASKSLINIGLQNDGQPVLCYTSEGKPYNIPQFHRHEKEAIVSVPNEQSDGEKQVEDFLAALKCFSGKYVFLKSEYIPEGDIIIGFFDEKYYVATNSEQVNEASIKKDIYAFIKSFKMKELEYGEHHAVQSHIFMENSDIARVYAKVAINVLALLKGVEYASHTNFSNIRNWIVSGESSNDYFFLPQVQNEKNWFMNVLPNKAHWCVLTANNYELQAIVCFYNRYMRRFNLGKLPDDEYFLVDGYICDWENEQEYSLAQFVDTIVGF